MHKSFIVAGIGTEIGKTLISAIFTQALKADYWKPIQSGNPEEADALFIKKMTQLPNLKVWDSSYVLSCLLYTSPSPRDRQKSRMPSSA